MTCSLALRKTQRCSLRNSWISGVSTCTSTRIVLATSVPSPPTSDGAQRRRLTDTSIFSVWASHTDAARPSLAAVFGTHRFHVGSAHLTIPAWPGATISFRLHPARRRFQPPPSPVVVILAAIVIRRTRLSTVGDRAFPVAGSRLWNSPPLYRPTLTHLQRWLFFGTAKFPPFPITSFVTVLFFQFCTPCSSGLAILYLSHSKYVM